MTFTAGSVLTAAQLNTYVRDNSTFVGLVELSSTTFTAQSSVAVNPFSATYDNYRVVLRVSASSGDPTVYMKLRSGSTDASTTYSWGAWLVDSSGTSNLSQAAGGTAGFHAGLGYASYPAFGSSIDLYGPFLAAHTAYSLTHGHQYANDRVMVAGGTHRQATSYDGINIIPSTGTITGSLRVYGYQNT